jgi:tetratricopeptide (TPR) repeat protein
VQTPQHIQQSEHRGNYKRLPPVYTFIAFTTFILFAIGVGAGFLNFIGAVHGSIYTILAVVFIMLGIVFSFLQWLFPSTFASHDHTTLFSTVASTTLTSDILQISVVPSVPVQSFPNNKNVYRNILDIPPPTSPKTIQQRTSIVKDVYTQLIKPDVNAIVLTGLGGVGKSTLAALIHRYTEDHRRTGMSFFTEKSIWMRIDANVTVSDLAETLFAALHESKQEFKHLSPRDGAIQLFNALRDTDKRRLIILDQFESLLDLQTGKVLENRLGVGEWLEMLNSQPCTCRVLLVSRLWPKGTLEVPEFPPTFMLEYPVKGLEVAEGIELLRQQGVEENQASESDLQQAVEHCEGHALSLTLLASLLRQDRSLRLHAFLTNSAYAQLWTGNIARNLLDYIYRQQLNLNQRRLLLAFSIYREPVSWEAVNVLIQDRSQSQILSDIEVLLAQHLLRARGADHYQLHIIVSNFAQAHFDEADEQANQHALRVAHINAARFYLQQAVSYPSRGNRSNSSDVQPLIEAIWHQCQAKQWQEAYNLVEHESIFDDLKRWGANELLLDLYQWLLPLAAQIPKSVQAICIHSNLGRIYRTLGKRESAKENLEKALSICQEVGNRKEEGTALSFLGSVYADLGQLEQARECLIRALHIREEIEDHEGEGWTLASLGQLYDELGQTEQALAYCDQSLMILREVKNRRGEERTLNILGHIYDYLGQKKEAQEYYERALDICREIKDRVGEALALDGLGLIYVDLGQWDKSLQYLKQSLNIRREVGDRGGEGRTLNNLGRVYRIQGQTEDASIYLYEANNVCKAIRDRLGEGKVLNNLGLLYYDQEKNHQALEYLEQALKICQKVGDRPSTGWTLHNLGRVYDSLGEMEQAQKYYEQAFTIRKKIRDRRGLGWTLRNLAEHYYNQRRFELALAALLVAQKIFTEVQSQASTKIEGSIDNLCSKIGEDQFTKLLSKIKPQADQIVEQALPDRVP